jgi:signal recognition particle receptor subunit beta
MAASGVTARFLVTGGAGAGKSTFIASVSPQVQINETLTIQLVEAELEAAPEFLSEVLGIVLLVDGTTEFSETPLVVDDLRKIRRLPLIIAVTKQDLPGVAHPLDVLGTLPENTEIKVFPCVNTDRAACENVLLALIFQMLSSGGS